MASPRSCGRSRLPVTYKLAAKPRIAVSESEEKKRGRVWSELQPLGKITLYYIFFP